MALTALPGPGVVDDVISTFRSHRHALAEEVGHNLAFELGPERLPSEA